MLLRRRAIAAPHRSVEDPTPEGEGLDQSRDAASPELSCPTTQSRFDGSACMVATDPSATACHVRGLSTPIAAYTIEPTGARGAGASLGLTLQGVPFVHERYSSRSPCLPDVTDRPNSPRGVERERPPSRPCSRDESVLSPELPEGRPDRRCLHGLCPYRVFSPSARALACSHDAGPLVLGGDDVPTRLDLRASRFEWIGMVRFRTAYSRGVSHLATVTALHSASRGAGSWFHLTQDDRPR